MVRPTTVGAQPESVMDEIGERGEGVEEMELVLGWCSRSRELPLLSKLAPERAGLNLPPMSEARPHFLKGSEAKR